MVWKVLCNDVSVRQQHIPDGLGEGRTMTAYIGLRVNRLRQPVRASAGESHLGESLHVVAYDLRVGTLQFADDFKTLIELREHVHHRAGEQSVLRRDLELQNEKKGGESVNVQTGDAGSEDRGPTTAGVHSFTSST